MNYEIQKRSTIDQDIWYMIAQSDTKKWAKNIVDTLNSCKDGEYRYQIIK